LGRKRKNVAGARRGAVAGNTLDSGEKSGKTTKLLGKKRKVGGHLTKEKK